jgi:thioesterase domain-containing protein
MAAYYVDAIRRFRPRGPYRLGGWSFGGVVAWEMARQLRAAGEAVDLLALLDTSPLTDETIAADPRDPAEVMMQTIGGYAGWMAAERIRMDEVRHLPSREMVVAMIRQVGDERLLPESRADLILSLTAVRSANLRAQATYDLQPYGGHLTYFRTEASAQSALLGSAHEFWGSRAGSITTAPSCTSRTSTSSPSPCSTPAAAQTATDPAREIRCSEPDARGPSRPKPGGLSSSTSSAPDQQRVRS